jgi:NAD(P)H-nitrite reductase large subunit
MIDEKASKIIEHEFTRHSVKIHFKTGFKEILGNDKGEVIGVITSEGKKIECDGVFICTGIRPNTTLAKDAGLQVNRGIITSQYLQTSDPDVYAAGDVVEFFDDTTQTHRFIELWGPAGKMGTIAALNMLGQQKSFNIGSVHAYTVFWGHNCHSIGDYNPALSNQLKIIQKESQGAHTKNYMKLIFKGRQLIGALTLGEARDPLFLVEIISRGLLIPQNITLEALLEPEFDLEQIIYQK